MSQFTYITDLPPAVRGVLDIPLQQLFMDSYNTALQLVGSDQEAFQIAWLKVLQTAFPGEILTLPTMPNMAPSPAPVGSPGAPLPTLGMSEYGYLVDLTKYELDEAADAGWIQAMPLGSYNHPVYGKIDITPERIQEFAANVNNNVRGQELDIDYDHKDKTNEAAGWVKKAEARSDGLWLFVDWTKKAAQAIREKAYRYFSPEFVDEWTHPKTGVKMRNVLFGGGLTNRPFLKDILPVNLSEIFTESGGNVDPKKLRKLLGLPDDATDDQVQAKIDESITKLETNPEGENQGEGENGGENEGQGEGQPQGEPAGAQASDGKLPANILQLAENDPVVRTLMDRVVNLEAANRLSEVNLRLSELANPSKGKYAIAPAVLDELRAVACEAPKALGDKVIDLVSKIQQSGLVELGERGANRGGSNVGGLGKSASERVTAAIQKKMSENDGLSYTDALESLAIEDPQLYDEYRNESYVRMRGE